MRQLLTAASALALVAGGAEAQSAFNRIASFATPANMTDGSDTGDETSAEIIAATEDGMTLIYTDSPLGVVGRIDISDPANPAQLGNVEMDGEPTSVAVTGTTAIVGVNTSESYTEPSGTLAALDVSTGATLSSCDLGGQPDSIAIAPDASFVSVAIENERDEDAGNGRVPQMPAGMLVMYDVSESGIDCDSRTDADLTGLAEVAPEDPEPEFVDINGVGETVVTLQENNHIAIVARDGTIVGDFSAGTVDLKGIDAAEDGVLDFTGEQPGRLREPDAVKWIDDQHFATANEGDMDGGSRGWTIFRKDGTVVYESGPSFEHALIEVGHYPEGRSDAKGVEPESIEVATFGGTPMVFVGSERGSAVGVYDVTDPAAPVLTQILPSGIGPEGYAAIPERNLLVSANETDLGPDGGVRAHVMVFEYGEGPAQYPTLTSAGATDEGGGLIGWGAISGMVAGEDGTIYAVNDSFYSGQPTIFVIDASQTPARITRAIRVTRDGEPAQNMDMEGIALADGGGFWIANEGDAEDGIPHAIYRVSADGAIEEEIGLPAELGAHQRSNGFEGITRVGDTLWLAVQREWGDDPDDQVKLLAYDTGSGDWGAVLYPLETLSAGWVGLSEITADGDYVYIVERDNQIGGAAALKELYRVPLSEMQPAPIGGELPVVSKELVRDLIPDLEAYGGYVVDKVEGFAVDAGGNGWISTDNDGVDDSSGETFFWSIGPVASTN